MRKLRDSNKLSNKAEKYKVWTEASPLVDTNLFLKISPHQELPYEYYDQSQKARRKINIHQLCNYLIHSFHLWLVIGEKWNSKTPEISFLVNSDHSEDEIFEVTFDDWFDALEYIYTDDIVSASQTRNEETGRMEYTRKVRYE